MSLNQLGNFTFVSFHAVDDRATPPEILGEQCETVQRPGSDGTGVILLGEKSEAFQMRSIATCASFPAAVLLAKLHKAYQGQGPFGIIWGGVNYTTLHTVVYVPLAVKIVKIRALSAASDGSVAYVETLWTLQPIKTPPPP